MSPPAAYAPPALLFPVLLAWSAGWGAASLLALDRSARAARPEGAGSPGAAASRRGFWLMSGLWAAANVLILAWGLWSPAASREELLSILKLNAGLDVIYLAVAAVLKSRRRPLLDGFALAIAIQGGFLLAFDLFWIFRLA